jgi:hypothetical protein
MKPFFCGLMALGLLVCLAGHAKAQATYAFTPFDVPCGYYDTTPYGINASGQIVGVYENVEIGPPR